MLLNKKYKCPVCFNESITLKDIFSFDNKGYILCNTCNSRLEFTRSTFVKAYISFALFYMATVFFESMETKIIIFLVGVVIMMAYYILFGELEEYIPEEPAYNFNEFLDGLRNTDTKKSL